MLADGPLVANIAAVPPAVLQEPWPVAVPAGSAERVRHPPDAAGAALLRVVGGVAGSGRAVPAALLCSHGHGCCAASTSGPHLRCLPAC